jgi:flagellin-like hook-associated protein FlgL
LGVIDEKLVRMKELAEQAATGTYTTAQREIINSEYLAMAAEIDRIANATNFNGIKLLDGSVTNQHGGQGLKIHFGVSNNPAEDYYFVNIGDARATSSTGLRIGGDARNDIWGQGAAGAGPLAGPGCCTAGYSSLDGNAGFVSGETFSYGYNWDWMENSDSALLTGHYLAGRYTVGSSDSLQTLINKVNDGTQSRVGVSIDSYLLQQTVQSGGTVAVCVGDEAYYWGDTSAAMGTEYTTSSYTFSFANTNYMGANNIWASGSLASLIRDGRALSLSAQFTASSASAASSAQVSLMAALNAAFSGVILTSASVNADTQSAAIIASLNITGQDPLLAQTYGTGIYANTSGMWTASATLANQLGFNEIMFSVSAVAATSALCAVSFGNHAWFASSAWGANVTSGVTRGVGDTLSAGIYVSGNYWTNSATIATALDFYGIDFDYTTLTSVYAAANTVNIAAHFATMFTSGTLTANSPTFGTGIWIGTGGTAGLWTTDEDTATALGLTQLTIALSANSSAKLGGLAVSARLTNSVIDQMNTDWSVGNTGVFTVDLFHQNGAMTNWTTSATIRDHFNLFNTAANSMTTTALTINVGGIGTYDDFRAAIDDALDGGVFAAYATTAVQVTRFGDGYAQAVAKTGALAALATGTNQITALGSTWTDMANSFADYLDAANLDPQFRVTSFTARDMTATQTRLANLLNSNTTEISSTAITAIDRTNLDLLTNIARRELTPVLTRLGGAIDSSKIGYMVGSAGSNSASFTAMALASAINANQSSQFWAMVQSFNSNGVLSEMVYIFTKLGGNFNDLLACDVAASDEMSRAGLDALSFENVANSEMHEAGTTFTLGGEHWALMKPTQTNANLGNEVWNVTLNGRDVGAERDLWIANAGEIDTPNLDYGIINGMDRNSFV